MTIVLRTTLIAVAGTTDVPVLRSLSGLSLLRIIAIAWKRDVQKKRYAPPEGYAHPRGVPDHAAEALKGRERKDAEI